jgi:hypothetical protein
MFVPAGRMPFGTGMQAAVIILWTKPSRDAWPGVGRALEYARTPGEIGTVIE